MNPPKWQRARVVSHNPVRYSLVGRELWVKVGSPQDGRLGRIEDGSVLRVPNAIETNIEQAGQPGSGSALASLDTLELLARGPEDFADDVELVKWEDWLKEPP